MPLSFFTSVARAALATEDTDAAVAALNVMLEQSKPYAAAETLYRLARCVVELAQVLRSETLDKWTTGASTTAVESTENGAAAAATSDDDKDENALIPTELLDGDANTLLQRLVRGTQRVVPWGELESALSVGVCERRAVTLWRQVLRVVVERNGIHDAKYPEVRADVAQDRLLDTQLFDFLYGNTDSDIAVPAEIVARLRVARGVLQVVVELSQDYLVGAAEQLIALLRCSAESPWLREVATWLFPSGVVVLDDVPTVGELGQERETARQLWEQCFLFQIEATTTCSAAHATLEGANVESQALKKLASVMDDALNASGREPSAQWVSVASRLAASVRRECPSRADE
ncbi:hypothetical protein PINS_up011877 [Pythium insidiosum]|nr:hypothetical protein PINS_up011877 [Pythium insidiosum]